MKAYKLASVVLMGSLLQGCFSMRASEIGPNSHFIYKNSTVKLLGEVKEDYSSFTVLIPPSYDFEDGYDLYKKALSQKPGADLIVNYRVDTKIAFSTFPLLFVPWYYMSVSLHGTAADMEVGGAAK